MGDSGWVGELKGVLSKFSTDRDFSEAVLKTSVLNAVLFNI